MILIQSIPVTDKERDELLSLVETSTFDERQRSMVTMKIYRCEQREDYDSLKQNLLSNQLGIEGANNPSQTEIGNHIRKITKVPA